MTPRLEGITRMKRLLGTFALACVATVLAASITPAALAGSLNPSGLSSPSASAAPISTLPSVVYTSTNHFKADGVSHEFIYPKTCSDGLSGCYVKITVTGLKFTRPQIQDLGNSHPYDPPNYEDVTDDYVTCTGWLGQCYNYTEAKLRSEFEFIDGDIESVYDQTQYCGAAGWNCQGLAGTYVQWDPIGGNTVLSGYGGQVYNSSGGSQTKYANTIMYGNGTYDFSNTCGGYLC